MCFFVSDSFSSYIVFIVCSAESYVKIMEAVVKQGTDFLKREVRRVQNLLKGKVINKKRFSFHVDKFLLLRRRLDYQ